MLCLDVPFVTGGEYPPFLAKHGNALCSVYFSLHHPAMADARQLMDTQDFTAMISGLSTLSDTPQYVLMNARLHAPDKYFTAKNLDSTVRLLSELIDKTDISGLIFSDAYYIQALSDAYPEVVKNLEAVPSVNALLDSADRAFAMLDMIATTEFKPPSKLVLDRALNRDMKRLEKTVQRIRTAHPTIKLNLIANEGCLFECPYKPTHDAHIALVNEGLCGERTFAMNRDFGCIRRLLSDPAAMLTSPFIRPEDTTYYEGLVDGIKLCGRNRGVDFLKQAITAYLHKEYDGNLLDLMDAMGDLADQRIIPNAKLPDDFLKRVTTCSKDCRSCGWCADLSDDLISRIDPELTTL